MPHFENGQTNEIALVVGKPDCGSHVVVNWNMLGVDIVDKQIRN